VSEPTEDLVSIELVVVGIDATETALAAAQEAAELARRLGARLHIVSAVTSDRSISAGAGPESVRASSLELAEQVLADVASQLQSGVEVTTSAVRGKPADVIVDEAKRLDADLIVVGSKRMTGISRVLGSVANDVAHHAGCSVYIAKTTG
jgi:nucleotide-binding universal stress UspA family protein